MLLSRLMGYYQREVPPEARDPSTRLLSEYVAAKFPGAVVLQQAPLGPGPDPTPGELPDVRTLRSWRSWRPRVDALVVREGVLLIIESEVLDPLRSLSKLPFYRSLLATTPELQAVERYFDGQLGAYLAGQALLHGPLSAWESRMRLVIPRAHPWIEHAAVAQDVEVDLYEPTWLGAYLDYRSSYWTRSYQDERQRVMEARKRLGL